VGDSLGVRGDWKEALAHYEQGLAIHDAGSDPASAQVTLIEYAALLRARASTCSWALGWPDQALRQSQKAVEDAEMLSLPATLAIVTACDCGLRIFRGEVPAALQQAEQMERLAAEWGLTWYALLAIPSRGWCLAHQGRSEEAVGLLRTWLPRCRAAGGVSWRPMWAALGADACVKAGASQDALDLLDDARAVVEKTGERWWEAEVLRARAETLLSLGDEHQAEAERLFRQAIDVARHQETRSFELRAVTGLSRLLRKQHRKGEARRMLADIYGWFTEGFDTKDLREARTLLDELR
jgi:predicted ATPase